MKSSLHAASQKHNDKLMESLKYNKYQYGVSHMTVANPVCRRFDAVEVDDMLKQE